MYEIEKDIEVMPKSKYPLASMEVGDSFECTKKDRLRVAAAVINYTKKHGGKFTVRVDTVRCWRVE